MQVFRAFFKIVKTDFPVLLLYLGLSIFSSFLFAGQGSVTDEIFSSERSDVCVVDRAHTDLSKAIVRFFEKTSDIIDLRDDIDAYQDALFFRDIDLLAIISEDGTVKITSAPGSLRSTYANMQLENFLSTLEAYRSAGEDTVTAADRALANLDIETAVTFKNSDEGASNRHGFKSFFSFMPYGLLASLIHCIGSIMIAFNKKDLKARMECSSLSLRSKNFSLIVCCVTVTVAIWLFYNLLIFAVYGSEALENPLIFYYVINSLVMAFAALGIGFLVGTISTNEEHISFFVVSLSLGLSFLGGVFVSQSIMGSGTKMVSRFLPTFWYIKVHDELSASSAMTDSLAASFAQGIAIQLAFTAAILGISFFVSKVRVSARTA
ncbi:MAG: ABC transporter permease [Lachnospiraceae bacterium]|nr:ABC transporter permease [Lachnospiraceae bacterium]